MLMQAHTGNRGGSAMLEHFQDLANQKKMDAPTLKAAFGSEIDSVSRGHGRLDGSVRRGGVQFKLEVWLIMMAGALVGYVYFKFKYGHEKKAVKTRTIWHQDEKPEAASD
jgi:hypothetical protein